MKNNNHDFTKAKVSYVDFSDIETLNASLTKETTEIEGVKNYLYKEIMFPVLDRKFLDKFNPKKTCISVCGGEKFKVDKDKLINDVIEEVERLKKYHTENPHGQKEHIGEYDLFSNLEIKDFMLDSYSFDQSWGEDKEYYLILWYTPKYNRDKFSKHIYCGMKKMDNDFY